MKISVFGLGYVGAVSMACLARDGHVLTGVDIDAAKLRLIESGQSPIIEDGIVELMADVVSRGRVAVSDDATSAILTTDLSFVCVGTPSRPNGSQDLTAIVRLCEQIGTALRQKQKTHTVVVRSTVEPGTVEETVIPLLESHSGKKEGLDFSVCFQPEFLREGSSIRDYDNPPMTVVGSRGGEPVELLRELFGQLPCEFIQTDIRTAETLKYGCNVYHALKITFANEIGRICQAIGSDSLQVMKLLCADRQLNISTAYLRPGFAFGGSCLPKDLKALLYMAKSNDIEVPMLSGLLPSNRLHVEHAARTILARGVHRVGVIGLSFKSGTDDLRESPLVHLVEILIGKGMQLVIYDPEVRISQLLGANKRYIDEVVPHIGSLMCETLDEVMAASESVVIGLSGDDIAAKVCAQSRNDQRFLDLVGIEDPSRLKGEYHGICW
jgi:GDP-mannose 6-dehydrogenase